MALTQWTGYVPGVTSLPIPAPKLVKEPSVLLVQPPEKATE